jgi:FAD:protein FMN transferase
MATRFEFVLCGDDNVHLRAAGEEAIREIRRIENKFSFYQRNSIISQINKRAGYEPVRVDSETFSFLENVFFLFRKTDGAFDPTVAPLMKAWGFLKQSGSVPEQSEIDHALRHTGMNRIHLNKSDYTVQLEKPGVMIDPGGIGKGYALDQAALLLKESGIEHALIHGGTSTVIAWGKPPDEVEWKIAIKHPDPSFTGRDEILNVFELNNSALSVSAVWGKAFESDGKILGHVIDPRTGRPVDGAQLAACTAESATFADAYSTAMLVLSTDFRTIVSKTDEIFSYFILLNDGNTISHS